MNRGDIVKKFKNGELAYKETALGMYYDFPL